MEQIQLLKIFRYYITDVYEPPPNGEPTIDSSGSFNFVLENQTSIGSISASDPEGDSLIYSISGSEINISNTGVLTLLKHQIMKPRILTRLL